MGRGEDRDKLIYLMQLGPGLKTAELVHIIEDAKGLFKNRVVYLYFKK